MPDSISAAGGAVVNKTTRVLLQLSGGAELSPVRASIIR